jgi:hypothetical protein
MPTRVQLAEMGWNGTMSSSWWPAWCFFLFALLGCSMGGAEPCNPPLGDFGVYGFKLESATVAWALDSIPLHSAAVVSTNPAVGDCQLRVAAGRLASPSNSEFCQRDTNASVFLDCAVTSGNPTPPMTIDPAALWSTEISGLGDPRTWATGNIVLPNAYLGEWYPSYLWDSAGCQTGKSIFGNATGIRVVVEESAGGIADFPLLVTPDYRRVFRVELDVANTLAGNVSGTCGVVATMTLLLRLTQTPDDFTVRNQPCALCK